MSTLKILLHHILLSFVTNATLWHMEWHFNSLLVMAPEVLPLLSFIVFIKDVNYELLWFKFHFTSMTSVPLFTFRQCYTLDLICNHVSQFRFWKVWFFHEGEFSVNSACHIDLPFSMVSLLLLFSWRRCQPDRMVLALMVWKFVTKN